MGRSRRSVPRFLSRRSARLGADLIARGVFGVPAILDRLTHVADEKPVVTRQPKGLSVGRRWSAESDRPEPPQPKQVSPAHNERAASGPLMGLATGDTPHPSQRDHQERLLSNIVVGYERIAGVCPARSREGKTSPSDSISAVSRRLMSCRVRLRARRRGSRLPVNAARSAYRTHRGAIVGSSRIPRPGPRLAATPPELGSIK